MPTRKIIEIDENKCDGCELCVSACHEGAIAMVDGKAKLVSDTYCDGLGDCLAECPQDAITIIEREAQPFDEQAVQQHLAEREASQERAPDPGAHQCPAPSRPMPLMGGCPGAAARQLRPLTPPSSKPKTKPADGAEQPSALRNWPIQLHLVPVQAPYYEGATILLAADCIPFAYPDFHQGMLQGRTLIIGCPKLDDSSAYLEKLAAIFRFNDVKQVEVAFMEVPCCHGLVRLVQQAVEKSGKNIPVQLTEIGIQGEVKPTVQRASA